eukprot:365954-Chlamydomonas_euryale.AAC.4
MPRHSCVPFPHVINPPSHSTPRYVQIDRWLPLLLLLHVVMVSFGVWDRLFSLCLPKRLRFSDSDGVDDEYTERVGVGCGVWTAAAHELLECHPSGMRASCIQISPRFNRTSRRVGMLTGVVRYLTHTHTHSLLFILAFPDAMNSNIFCRQITTIAKSTMNQA